MEGLSLQSASHDQRCRFLYQRIRSSGGLEWPDPCRSIQFVLHACVAMPCAAHESRAPDYITASVSGDDFLTPQPVLRGNDRSFVEAMSYGSHGTVHLRGFRCDDAQIALG